MSDEHFQQPTGASIAPQEILQLSRHELRTPLHHILGCTELLLDDAEDPRMQALVPDLEAIHTNGKQLLTLVEELTSLPGREPDLAQAPSIVHRLTEHLTSIMQRCTALQEQVNALGHEEMLGDLEPIDAAARRLLTLIHGEVQDGSPSGAPPRARQEERGADAAGTGQDGQLADESPGAVQPLPRSDLPPTSPVVHATLLVVDDNAVNRDTLARRLERLGYTILRASNGREALDLLTTAEIDLVLLDIMMPEMDGYEVLQQRRADARLRDIPFIMISAVDEIASVVRCIEMGAEDYLPKPFDPVLLRARIGACLEKKRLRDQERIYQAQLAEWNRTLETRVQQQVEELERVGRLRRFLAPQVAEVIMSAGDERILESHRREITVVFTDLRGFTAFAGTAEPEDVMGVLREYHAAMGELIFRFEGTLERFAGDGLMVFFNDPLPCPDPAARAVRMAVAMRERVGDLSQEWKKRGHQLGFGVGIAQGYATLGKIGFEGRFDYGAIGTVTNLASRLCDEAASGQILLNQRAYAAVEDLVEAEGAGDLTLKGFYVPLPAYHVIGLR